MKCFMTFHGLRSDAFSNSFSWKPLLTPLPIPANPFPFLLFNRNHDLCYDSHFLPWHFIELVNKIFLHLFFTVSIWLLSHLYSHQDGGCGGLFKDRFFWPLSLSWNCFSMALPISQNLSRDFSTGRSSVNLNSYYSQCSWNNIPIYSPEISLLLQHLTHRVCFSNFLSFNAL